MTIIDNRTPNLNLALPHKDNQLGDDVGRLREALTAIDTAMPAKADLVAGKVPASQLPSYVDDVVEVADFESLPTTGEAEKIYVTLDNNATFRWSGSAYVEIAASPGSTDAVPEGATNKYFTDARAVAAVPVASASTAGKVKVGAGLGIDANGVLYAASGGGSTMTVQEITPASNGLSSVPVPGGYVVGAILVSLNGACLAPSDYTATDGVNIAFVGMTVGTSDSIVVTKLSTVVIGDLPAGSVGATQLAAGAALSNLGFTPANKAGETMTGPLVLPGNATNPLEAVPKQQLDAAIAGITASGYMLVRDEKPQGTDGGGTTVGTTVTRVLNTVSANTISGASLASNQITLPAGTYRIKARAPVFAVNLNKAIFYNVTDAVPAIVGTAENGALPTESDPQSIASIVVGRITISLPKVFELRHYLGNTRATDGLGAAVGAGGVEVYSIVEIIKE